MSFLNQRSRRGIVLADQGSNFAQQFAQESAREVVIVIRGFDECAGAENDVFAIVRIQVVEIVLGTGWYAVGITNDMSEDGQTVDHDPQGARLSS